MWSSVQVQMVKTEVMNISLRDFFHGMSVNGWAAEVFSLVSMNTA